MHFIKMTKHTGRMRAFFITVVITLCCAIPAVASAADARDYDWFWFLYEKDHASHYPSTLVTPFYFTSTDGRKIYTASLPPFIFWKYTTDHSVSRNWVLGLAGDIDYRHSNGVPDYDLGIMPLVLAGKSPDARDRYFFLWPIGGTIKGKLGMDYISPWVFPGVALFFLYPPKSMLYIPLYIAASIIPAYVSYGKGDYQAGGILWPFIQWGSSPTRSEFRFLPLYAHNYEKDHYDNYSYLMLINYNRLFYKNRREVDTFFFIPFIARRWDSERITGSSALMWPFFSWGYNKKQGDFELNFPWPLFVYQRSKEPYIKKTIIFPLYGSIRYNSDETEFITPLYISLKRDNATFSSRYYVSFFIIWYFTRDYKKNVSDYYGKEWKFFKIWPILRYEYNDKGDVHFNILSILPFRDAAGYEKIYDPMFSLIEYHRENNVRRFGLLMRTYYQCWDDRFFRARIPFLFSYASVDGRVTEFKILFSMFGYERNKGGAYVRFIWIPIRVGEGTDDDLSIAFEESDPLDAIPQYEYPVDKNTFTLGRIYF
jgi:hypothetical protein